MEMYFHFGLNSNLVQTKLATHTPDADVKNN